MFNIQQDCKNIKVINKSSYDTTYASGTIYLWDFGDGTIITNQENPTHTYDSAGTYTITLKVRPNTKCEAQFSQAINIPYMPTPKFVVEIRPCTFIPVFINLTQPKTQFYWEINGKTFSQDTLILSSFTTSDLINASLILVGDKNCYVRRDTTLLLSKSTLAKIYVPNAFTPNGDGINDFFEIIGEGYECLKSLTIYDRWGNIVFKTNSLPLKWDGTRNGKPAGEGVYVYVIEAITGDKRAGTVTLIR